MTRRKLGRGILAEELGRRLRALRPRPTNVHLVLDRWAEPAVGAALERALEEAGLPWTRHAVRGGEAVKELGRAERLCRAMVRAGADRSSFVLAAGGGASTDLAGFCAAVLLRGVRWGVIPTTLLAMVDAGLGGKTAVDLPEGKNLIGAFHPPEFLVADLQALRTLPEREWSNGLGEAVKTALLAGPRLVKLLEEASAAELRRAGGRMEQLVRACQRHKAAVVARDPRDGGERKLLNLGHTFGHALETAAGPRRLAHGEAVGLGLLCAVRLSADQGLCDPDFPGRVERLLRRARLPLEYPGRLPAPATLRALLRRDKKAAAGGLELILPLGPGQALLVTGVAAAEAERALRRALG